MLGIYKVSCPVLFLLRLLCASGLFLDAKAAMDLLLSRSDIDTRKIIVFGRSLGGAVAVKICSYPAYIDR